MVLAVLRQLIYTTTTIPFCQLLFLLFLESFLSVVESCGVGAEDEIRTRDPRLGKAMLYP